MPYVCASVWSGLKVNSKYACKDVKKTLVCFLCYGGKLLVKSFLPLFCGLFSFFFPPIFLLFSGTKSQLSFPCDCPVILLLSCSQLFSIALSSLLTQFFSRQLTTFLQCTMKWKSVLSHSYPSSLSNASRGGHCNWEWTVFLLWRKIGFSGSWISLEGFYLPLTSFWTAKNSWKLNFSSGI